MIDKNKEVKIKNRDSGAVGYTIPDLGNLRRDFQPGEEKIVTFNELEKLTWIPGGKYILEQCLIIEDKDVVKELLGEVEPEYNYTEVEIKKLLEEGTLDQLQDCLDFAPVGVKELLKRIAVDIRLDSEAKRQIILQKLGFNVSEAIRLTEESKNNEDEEDSGSKRRSNPITSSKGERKAPQIIIKEDK